MKLILITLFGALTFGQTPVGLRTTEVKPGDVTKSPNKVEAPKPPPVPEAAQVRILRAINLANATQLDFETSLTAEQRRLRDEAKRANSAVLAAIEAESIDGWMIDRRELQNGLQFAYMPGPKIQAKTEKK